MHFESVTAKYERLEKFLNEQPDCLFSFIKICEVFHYMPCDLEDLLLKYNVETGESRDKDYLSKNDMAGIILRDLIDSIKNRCLEIRDL